MLPNLAQNNTIDDFTTAAVEMRGFRLWSEIFARMSRERWKIFPEGDQAAKNVYRFLP